MGHDDTPDGNAPRADLPPDVDEYVRSLGGPDPKPRPPPEQDAGETPTAPQDPTDWSPRLRADVRISDGTSMKVPDTPTPPPAPHEPDLADGEPSAYELEGEPGNPATAGSGGAHLVKWAAIAAGAIVALVVGIILALGGGNDGGDEGKAGGRPTPTQAASSSGNGAQPGSGGFLASAGLPTDLAYTATNVTTGQSFSSTIRVNSSCSGKTCAYTSAFNPGAGMVRGTIPTVTWSHDGANWHVVLTAPIQSSSTNGADCVDMYTDTWDLTVLGAEQGGGLLRAVQLRGTLTRNQRMDPSLSRGVGTTCLPYDSTQNYIVTATPA